jgi:hypothetical protein
VLDVVEDDRNGPTVMDQHALARPIGWWLKEANSRLDAAFDDALQNTGVNRRGWQVLDLLAGEPVSRAELVDSLAAFDPTESYNHRSMTLKMISLRLVGNAVM